VNALEDLGEYGGGAFSMRDKIELNKRGYSMGARRARGVECNLNNAGSRPTSNSLM